jgi:hypothetical protein
LGKAALGHRIHRIQLNIFLIDDFPDIFHVSELSHKGVMA